MRAILVYLLACALLMIAADVDAVTLKSFPLPFDGIADPEVNHRGTEVAFVGYGGAVPSLFVYNLSTGDLRQLTFVISPIANPTWSPDDTKIAFNAYGPTSTQDIWIIDAVGGTPWRLVETNLHEQTPTWSPTGDKIAYSAGQHNLEDIWIKDAQLPNPPYSLNVPNLPATHLWWTRPNTILYRARSPLGSNGFSIWEIPATGGSPTELVADALYPGPQDMLSPTSTMKNDRLAVPIAPGLSGTNPYEMWLLVRDYTLLKIIASEDIGGGDAESPSWTVTGDSLFFAGRERLYLATDLPKGTVPAQKGTWGNIKDVFRR